MTPNTVFRGGGRAFENGGLVEDAHRSVGCVPEGSMGFQNRPHSTTSYHDATLTTEINAIAFSQSQTEISKTVSKTNNIQNKQTKNLFINRSSQVFIIIIIIINNNNKLKEAWMLRRRGETARFTTITNT